MAKIDQFIAGPLEQTASQTQTAQSIGVDGVWMGELAEDPFLYAVRAIEHSSNITVGTGIAVALARSPMSTAYQGYSLNNFAKGRFILGLGSQVKTQIEDRFSMPYSKPAARMREYVAALRAIWSAWQDGTVLNFVGDFYHHTSMEPLFTPKPSVFGPPKIYMAAVNPAMMRTAAQVADGVILMLMPPRYLREVVLPIIEDDLRKAGRSRSDFEICITMGSITGVAAVENEAELKAALDERRRAATYYLSVPNYKPMLEVYGYGEVQEALHAVRYGDLSQAEKWARMASLIPDELLTAFGIYGPAADLPRLMAERYGPGIDRYLLQGTDLHPPHVMPATLRAALP